MKRNAISKLAAWKENKNKKPLWITGIKGVGKTYLALDFAKSFYDGNLYVNFETNAAIRELFVKNEAAIENDDNMISLLCSYYQIPVEYIGNLLIILDEITECPSAVRALIELMKAGSNLSILIVSSQKISLDMSLFDRMTLYPMQFDEFLIAQGQEWYAEVIKGHYQTNRKVPEIVHNELLTSFEDYLIVGGMPEAVNDYMQLEDTYNVSEIHQKVFQTLLMYGAKHQEEGDALKLSQIMNITPSQLMKENKKFQYRLIRKGATYALYKDIIHYLVDNHFLYKNTKLQQEKIAEQESLQFQLYLSDVGVMNSMLHMDSQFVKMEEQKLQKTILETYVMQNLASNGYTPMFWESNSLAKIDFLIETKDGIIPMEVKMNDSSRSKSMGVYKSTFSTPYSIRITSKNFEYINHVKQIPFYALFCI